MIRLAIYYEGLVSELTRAVPEVHVDEPDLPPIALGALVDLLRESLEKGDPRLTERILTFVEHAAGSPDSRVRGQIQVSFLEDLASLASDCASVLERLGPTTQELRREYEREWGPICPGDRSGGAD